MPIITTEKEEKNELSQSTYKPTRYADESWEIVGEPPKDERFEPMEFSVLSADDAIFDPMFADYGGRSTTGEVKRWHLPEGIVVRQLVTPEEKKLGEDQIKQQQEEELQRLLGQAYEEGKEAAKIELVEESTRKLALVEERLSTVLQDMQAQLNENFQQIEKSAIQLSCDIANKIINQAVQINPEYIVVILREALELSANSVVSKIKVSPEDLEFIELVGLKKQLSKSEDTWTFEADSSISAGCVVETSSGKIDYQLDKAFERVKESIVGIIK